MTANSEKLESLGKNLGKLRETEQELEEKKENLLKITAQLASRRSYLESRKRLKEVPRKRLRNFPAEKSVFNEFLKDG